MNEYDSQKVKESLGKIELQIETIGIKLIDRNLLF